MFMVILKYTADTEKKYLISFSLPLFFWGGGGEEGGEEEGPHCSLENWRVKIKSEVTELWPKKKGVVGCIVVSSFS